MSTLPATMDFLLDQLSDAGPVSGRRMFGEYCLYFDARPIGLVCNDTLFLKITDAGQRLQALREPEEGAPFPGARPHLRISADHWDDRAWLCQLVRATAHHLPVKAVRQKSSGAVGKKRRTGKADAAASPRRADKSVAARGDTLADMPNLGPSSERMLRDAGLDTVAALRRVGAVKAFARVRQRHPRASLNLLWALEGALSGLPWQEVARNHRTSLLLALEQEQRSRTQH